MGCGTGRLAYQLNKTGHTNYRGFDVVEDFLNFARQKCDNPGYKFEIISNEQIPVEQKSVDILCFFSVFTHLLHEDSYRYLLSAKEVLKDDGKIIFSFLTFNTDHHWIIFDEMVRKDSDVHFNQFITNEQIEIWAQRLDLKIDFINTGETPFIPLDQPMKLDSGPSFENLASIGQGVCILSNQ